MASPSLMDMADWIEPRRRGDGGARCEGAAGSRVLLQPPRGLVRLGSCRVLTTVMRRNRSQALDRGEQFSLAQKNITEGLHAW